MVTRAFLPSLKLPLVKKGVGILDVNGAIESLSRTIDISYMFFNIIIEKNIVASGERRFPRKGLVSRGDRKRSRGAENIRGGNVA